jgi:type VI secretion system protein ImpA
MYTSVRDHRERARSIEREVLNAGDSISLTLRNWQPVLDGAQDFFNRGMADIEVLAWFTEANVRLHGFAGLASAFEFCSEFLGARWVDLRAADETSVGEMLGPFSGLNGISSEGSLIQPIRLSPLLPGHPFGTVNTWTRQRAERMPGSSEASDFASALQAVRGDELRMHVSGIVRCRQAFDDLTQTFEALCGADAPSSSFTKRVLEEAEEIALRIYREATGEDFAAEQAPAPAVENDGRRIEPSFETLPTSPEVVSKIEIRTREDAFSELLRIADFFRRSEPHSPISYSIETIVRRGRLPLPDLLMELVPDADARGRFLATAGIQIPEKTNS